MLHFLITIHATLYRSTSEMNLEKARLQEELNEANSKCTADYQYFCVAADTKRKLHLEISRLEDEMRALDSQLENIDKETKKNDYNDMTLKIQTLNFEIMTKREKYEIIEDEYNVLERIHNESHEKCKEKQNEKDAAFNGRVEPLELNSEDICYIFTEFPIKSFSYLFKRICHNLIVH